MTSLLDGSYIEPKFLADCIQEVKQKRTYVPTVLILSEEGFNGLLNAAFLYRQTAWLKEEYGKLGIKRIIWAHDVPAGAFELTSDKALDALLKDQPDLQVLTLTKVTSK